MMATVSIYYAYYIEQQVKLLSGIKRARVATHCTKFSMFVLVIYKFGKQFNFVDIQVILIFFERNRKWLSANSRRSFIFKIIII